MDFNEKQLEAILHGEGPAIVAAPAGSGKTSCFVHRIAKLTEKVAPFRILGVTYTKSAATNMKDRLRLLVNNQVHSELNISTIHSLCWSIIKDADVEISMAMSANCFKMPPFLPQAILEKYDNEFGIKLSTFTSAFSLAKNYNIRPHESLEFFEEKGFSFADSIKEAYEFYENERLNYSDRGHIGRYDFDDILMLAVDYLETNEDLRWRWGSKYKYILIDEAQDTSPVQFRVVELLLDGGNHNNVMLVGDLRQSIYGFRGAFPQYSQDFADKHQAKVINLTVNYRSNRDIVELANIIAANMDDIDPRFRPDMVCNKP